MKQSSTIPGIPSKEADKRELKLAKAEGKAYKDTLAYMTEEEAHGRSTVIDDYQISYAFEEAEGMYEWESDQLVWHNPTTENAHAEVAVADARDGRFIPYLEVSITIYNSDGDTVLEQPLPFLWHSWLYHYGQNIEIPQAGTYDIEIHVSSLRVSRHDKANGNRYTKPVIARFEKVKIETGQKKN